MRNEGVAAVSVKPLMSCTVSCDRMTEGHPTKVNCQTEWVRNISCCLKCSNKWSTIKYSVYLWSAAKTVCEFMNECCLLESILAQGKNVYKQGVPWNRWRYSSQKHTGCTNDKSSAWISVTFKTRYLINKC